MNYWGYSLNSRVLIILLMRKSAMKCDRCRMRLQFDIPDSWEWVRLVKICEYIRREMAQKYSPIKKYPVVSQKCNQRNDSLKTVILSRIANIPGGQ